MSKASGDHEPARAPRPRAVLAAVIALVVSGLFAFGASIALYGERSWLTTEQLKANSKAVSRAVTSAVASASSSSADTASASSSASASATKSWPVQQSSTLHDQVSRQQSGSLISTIVVMLALGLLAGSVYRGKHWSRWAVVAFWFLATFTQTIVGIGSTLSIGTSAPAAFKVPAFLAGAALIVALVLVNLPVSVAYFAQSKPDRGAGAPARRGMFAPRTPPARARRATSATPEPKSPIRSNAADRGEAYVQKQRAKKRATTNADAVAKGAELARNRAKASKSRRTTDG
jgi:hypothetical protein